ncbi:MFS transporter [Streptomyces sp. NPDC055400]
MTTTPTTAEHADALRGEQPQQPQSRSFVLSLVAAQGLVSISLFTPVVVSLSLRVEQIAPDDKSAALGVVLAVGAFLAMIANPVFGALSDRTTSRFGRRRPWLVGGMLVGLLGLILAGLAGNIALLTIGWAVAQLGINAALAALQATIPDRVPDQQRGKVSGAVGMMSYVAMVLGSFLAQAFSERPLLLFAVPGLLGVIGVLLLARALRGEQPADLHVLPPFRLGAFVRSFWVSPRRHPDFAWNFAGRFLMFAGMATVTSYMYYFVTDRLGQSDSGAAGTIGIAMLLMTVGAVAGSLGCGALSDRSGRRKPYVLLGALVCVLGVAMIASAHQVGLFLAAMLVFGLGLGAYLAVDTALTVGVLPSKADAAKDLGVLNIANALPQSLVPVIAPLFLAIGSTAHTNYTALYTFGAVCALVGALAIRMIRTVR